MEMTLNQSVQLMHAKVFESLKAWAGYEALEAAIRECSGVSVYLAGGAVRDLMRFDGRNPKDFDFFLAGAGIERFLECLSIAGDLRVGPFGSPRWFPQGAPDRYADVVPIARFYNGLWSCKDIVDALNQFDFTANAVALDLRTPRLFDPQHGVRDLKSGIIRAVRFDYPDEPISAGGTLTRLCVLWFRLIHYSQVLKFEVEPVTMQWLRSHSHFAAGAASFEKTFFKPVWETFHL
jgi:hypothetical protein